MLPDSIRQGMLGWLLSERCGRAGDCGRTNQANRERWLADALQHVPVGTRVLDAGAGESAYQPLCSHLDYVSQDIAQYDGAGDGDGLQMGAWNTSKLDIVSDIVAIPEADAAFGAVMCVEVLEHVPEPVAALRELVRLLEPGGTLIVTAPVCALTHFAPYFFQTGYSRYFYEHWYRELGLEILDLEHNGSWFTALAQELRRIHSVSDRYASSELDATERKALDVMLGTLARLSAADHGSEELTAHGIHVRARKSQPA